jgi:hypothetical protein
MNISKKYAQALIRKGAAVPTTTVVTDNGRVYQAVDRLDLREYRVDHYWTGERREG